MKKVTVLVDNCKRCQTCEHNAMFTPSMQCCLYIVDEGHPRPCPVGEDCTGYMKRSAKRVGILYLDYRSF